MLEARILELKVIIAENDGRNAADRNFARAVDELVGTFYDGISQLSDLPSRSLFDLFLIKTLYVERRSTHADVIDYLGEMLDSFMYAQRLYPAGADGRPRRVYFGDVTATTDDEPAAEQYEAYRRYADSALFFAGVLRKSIERRRPQRAGMLRRERATGVDTSYFVATGRASYLMASQQREADRTQTAAHARAAGRVVRGLRRGAARRRPALHPRRRPAADHRQAARQHQPPPRDA